MDKEYRNKKIKELNQRLSKNKDTTLQKVLNAMNEFLNAQQDIQKDIEELKNLNKEEKDNG